MITQTHVATNVKNITSLTIILHCSLNIIIHSFSVVNQRLSIFGFPKGFKQKITMYGVKSLSQIDGWLNSQQIIVFSKKNITSLGILTFVLTLSSVVAQSPILTIFQTGIQEVQLPPQPIYKGCTTVNATVAQCLNQHCYI